MRRLRRIAVFTAFVAGLAACAEPLGPADHDTDQGSDQAARLAHYRQAWSAAGIRDYQMTVKLGGAWAAGRATIKVRDGVPTSTVFLGQKRNSHLEMVFRDYDTVDELFERVQYAVEREADHLVVNYDRRLGLPVYAEIDLRFQIADDEHNFSIEDFRVLR